MEKLITISYNSADTEQIDSQERKRGLIQYKNPKSGSIVQFGDNVLAINQVRPYNGWEAFSPIVLQHLALFREVTGFEKIKQSKLRYINEINIPSEDSNIGDYFKYSPILPKELSTGIVSIGMNTENIFNSGRDILKLEFYNTKPTKENFVSFVLDISFILLKPQDSIEISMQDWINDAHMNINNIFEAILTEKCKSLFD